MNRAALILSAYGADHLAGDPEWFPHPIRLIGFFIARCEAVLRTDDQTPATQLISGTALTLVTIGATYMLSTTALSWARRVSPNCANALELLLAWTCLSARNLEQEATAVAQALLADNLPLARQRLARIVGRDTQHLNASEISRAVIETVAESASDGTISPLFYMVVGGVPLALAYKAVNTLDSMIGHADQRYFYFGKSAARLDDLANYIPARLTALFIIAASRLISGADPASAYLTWRRDANNHKSPNAGHPESATSGALSVMLGGPNRYAGELIPAPRMGAHFPPACATKTSEAIRLISLASLFGLTLAAAAAALFQPRKLTLR